MARVPGAEPDGPAPETALFNPSSQSEVCRSGHGWFKNCWRHATSYWEGAPTRLY